MNIKIIGFFVSILLFINIFTSFSYGKEVKASSEKTDKIVILIDQELYSRISSKFNRYIGEVENLFPVTLSLYQVENINYQKKLNKNFTNPEDIRIFLKKEYTTNQIKGALLVGQIPFAIWEQ
jgi:hypothetical protein